jgi:hypothetical protein
LYSIFFNWYYSQGFVDENARPETATADYYSRSAQKQNEDFEEDHSTFEDEFPLSNNYKLVESRPKTSMGFVVDNQKISRDGAPETIYLGDNNYVTSDNVKNSSEFDLSPSQTDTIEAKNFMLRKSNANSILRDSETNKPLTNFLTEEKNYDTIESHNDFSSKNYETSLKDPEFNTISGPKHSVSPFMGGSETVNALETLPNATLPRIDETMMNARIEN